MNTVMKKEALEYFGKRAFSRLFSLFKTKIESLGSASGTVKLEPSLEERKAIQSWLGLDTSKPSITISLTAFQKRIQESKFEGIELWNLVEWVTGSSIVLKKDKQLQEQSKKERYFQNLLHTYIHPNAQLLIHKIGNKEKGSTGFIKAYNANEYESIEMVLKAVSMLPPQGAYERLPIFAERVAGDPHCFDKQPKLYQALEMIVCEQEKREYRSKLNAEDETNLLSLVGLAKDDLHSFVTCYGLEASRDGKALKQWYWANEEKTAQNIPLRSMQTIDEVKPFKGNKVFVLENSGVYSSVLDSLGEVYPVVCTHGNFKLSGLLLLDKLVQSGAELYYSGDLDVNGVMMANSLKNRYGDKVHFWRMGKSEYLNCVSQVDLIPSAMKRLDSVDKMGLVEVIEEMYNVKKAGYQEPLLPLFLTDIVGEFFMGA